jgi:(R)-amidase
VKTELRILSDTYITGFPTQQNLAELVEPLDGPSIPAIHTTAKQRNNSVVVGIADLSVLNFKPPADADSVVMVA